MPYKRTYKKRKTRTSYYKTGMNAMSAANKALKIATGVKKLINVEYKQIQTVVTGLAIPDGVGTIVQLTNLSQGDSAITRDGQQVKLTSLQFRAFLDMNASAVDTNITILLVRDNQTNQAIYTTGDVLATTANRVSVLSPVSINNASRFRILKRWQYALSAASNSSVSIVFSKALNEKIRYDANVGDITDLTRSSLSLLFISDEPTDEPVVTFVLRLRFIDN